MKNIVVLTGAGISAESWISTFRDSGGLWEGHRVEDVASPEGWHRNKQLVLDFYNLRRADVLKAQPNAAHMALVELSKHFNVNIITQNVDDLHERAGSTNVLHLHGEILKVRSQAGRQQVYEWRKDLNVGDRCELGSQLRPHIVWFGEAVPEIENAIRLVRKADICIVIGTSMVVYPAAGLIHEAPHAVRVYFVNPDVNAVPHMPSLTVIAERAATGVPALVHQLINELC
jgi:NAD-dependent deacetylase